MKGKEAKIQVRVDLDLHKKFKAKCEDMDITPSQWIRTKIRDFLKGKK